MKPVTIGVVGAGVISTQYLDNLATAPDVRVVMVADLDVARARERAEQYEIADAGDVESLLSRPDIELVLNLTVPAAHVPVALAAVRAGKHVYSEKPLGLSTTAARELLAEASSVGVRVAAAPDTVLGPGVQFALRMIAIGDIGKPLTGLAMFQAAGPEAWHPSPEFLFARGGGPLFDMGPYYLTALVLAFGPARRVVAVGSRSLERRVIGSGPRAGTSFPVEVPTHLAGIIEFESGATAQLTFSFQSALPRSGVLEIAGASGTIVLPDPNTFEGPVSLWRAGAKAAEAFEVPRPTMTRGTGVVDMARAIRAGQPERCSGELALHVLDIMESLQGSAEHGGYEDVASTVAINPPLDASWDPRAATLVAAEDAS